jgi:hypothetical protein
VRGGSVRGVRGPRLVASLGQDWAAPCGGNTIGGEPTINRSDAKRQPHHLTQDWLRVIIMLLDPPTQTGRNFFFLFFICHWQYCTAGRGKRRVVVLSQSPAGADGVNVVLPSR